MSWRWNGVPLIAAVLLGFGCERAGSRGGTPAGSVASAPPTKAPAAASAPGTGGTAVAEPEVVYHLNRAQTNLPRVRLYVGPHEIESELCTSVTQVATGLMFREGIGTNDTMFFVFASGDVRSFYMKNVKFPIAAAYIDTDGVIQEIVQLKALDANGVPSRSDRIQYVLETAPDWFERNRVGPGALVSTPDGPLKSTLARRAQLP